MRRYALVILIILSSVLAALLQASFVQAIGRPYSLIDLPLFFSLFCVSVFDDRVAFAFFALSSVLVGLISSSSLLPALICGIAVLIGLNELSERFFTNRTYYSVLTIGTVGFIGYQIALWILLHGLRFVFPDSSSYHQSIDVPSCALATMALILFLSLCYLVTTLVSKRIRSYFIVTGRS